MDGIEDGLVDYVISGRKCVGDNEKSPDGFGGVPHPIPLSHPVAGLIHVASLHARLSLATSRYLIDGLSVPDLQCPGLSAQS